MDSSLSQREKMTLWPCHLADNCLGWEAMWVTEGMCTEEMLSFSPHFLWGSQEWKVCVNAVATRPSPREHWRCSTASPQAKQERVWSLFMLGFSGSRFLSAGIGMGIPLPSLPSAGWTCMPVVSTSLPLSSCTHFYIPSEWYFIW